MVKKKSIKDTGLVRDIPEGIKILAVFCFIGALFSFIAGGFLFSFSDSVSQNADIFIQQGIDIPSSMELIFLGIALLGLAILQYIVARDILKLKSWARNVVVVFSVFGIITAIANLTEKFFASGIFSLLVNLLIIWYLTIRKDTRKVFK
ncbi:DUF2127 domain-containing protein [Candidatus Pacearchaeota archaeon]|nr:DUF2127 domain-containing protein [Candidatus Pacearchaeota archaeon]